MPRKARAVSKLADLTTKAPEPEVVAGEKATLEERMQDARASISATTARITENVEDKLESVKSTVDNVLSIPEKFQREPVAWSLGALSAGFALGYALGRGHDAKTRGHASAVAEFSDEMAAELGAFLETLVPQSLAAEIKSSLGVDVPAALARISRVDERPKRRRARSKKASKA